MLRSVFVSSLMAICVACGAAPEAPSRTPEPAPIAPAAEPAAGVRAEPADSVAGPSGEKPVEPASAESGPAIAAPANAVEPAATAETAAPAEPVVIEATLVRRTGKQLRIELSGEAAAPAIDESATLLRFFASKPGDKSPLGVLGGLLGGGAGLSGWLAIAEVRVKKLEGKIVTLEIEAERSKMVVNGKPVNHFSPGAKLRLQATQ